MDQVVEQATTQLIEQIKNSETYLEYLRQRDRLLENPELYNRVNEFRNKNYEIQNKYQAEELFGKADELEREFESLWEIPLIGDFMDAEIAFCRMIQEVNMAITSEMDIVPL